MNRYLTSLLHGFVKKFVPDIDQKLQLSLWGGDVVLSNVELEKGALTQELGIPPCFKLTRCFIKSLRVNIPWSALTSQAVTVTIQGMDCVVTLCESPVARDSAPPKVEAEDEEDKTVDEEETEEVPLPGKDGGDQTWMKELIMRVLCNAHIVIKDLTFTLQEEERKTVPTVNFVDIKLQHCDFFAARMHDWKQAFVELLGPWKRFQRVFSISGLTVAVGRRPSSVFEPGLEAKKVTSSSGTVNLIDNVEIEVRAKLYLAGLIKQTPNVLDLDPSQVIRPSGPCISVEVIFQSAFNCAFSPLAIDCASQLVTSTVVCYDKEMARRYRHLKTRSVSSARRRTSSVARETGKESNSSTAKQSWGNWMWNLGVDPSLEDEEEVLAMSKFKARLDTCAPVNAFVICVHMDQCSLYLQNQDVVFSSIQIIDTRFAMQIENILPSSPAIRHCDKLDVKELLYLTIGSLLVLDHRANMASSPVFMCGSAEWISSSFPFFPKQGKSTPEKAIFDTELDDFCLCRTRLRSATSKDNVAPILNEDSLYSDTLSPHPIRDRRKAEQEQKKPIVVTMDSLSPTVMFRMRRTWSKTEADKLEKRSSVWLGTMAFLFDFSSNKTNLLQDYMGLINPLMLAIASSHAMFAARQTAPVSPSKVAKPSLRSPGTQTTAFEVECGTVVLGFIQDEEQQLDTMSGQTMFLPSAKKAGLLVSVGNTKFRMAMWQAMWSFEWSVNEVDVTCQNFEETYAFSKQTGGGASMRRTASINAFPRFDEDDAVAHSSVLRVRDVTGAMSCIRSSGGFVTDLLTTVLSVPETLAILVGELSLSLSYSFVKLVLDASLSLLGIVYPSTSAELRALLREFRSLKVNNAATFVFSTHLSKVRLKLCSHTSSNTATNKQTVQRVECVLRVQDVASFLHKGSQTIRIFRLPFQPLPLKTDEDIKQQRSQDKNALEFTFSCSFAVFRLLIDMFLGSTPKSESDVLRDEKMMLEEAADGTSKITFHLAQASALFDQNICELLVTTIHVLQSALTRNTSKQTSPTKPANSSKSMMRNMLTLLKTFMITMTVDPVSICVPFSSPMHMRQSDEYWKYAQLTPVLFRLPELALFSTPLPTLSMQVSVSNLLVTTLPGNFHPSESFRIRSADPSCDVISSWDASATVELKKDELSVGIKLDPLSLLYTQQHAMSVQRMMEILRLLPSKPNTSRREVKALNDLDGKEVTSVSSAPVSGTYDWKPRSLSITCTLPNVTARLVPLCTSSHSLLFSDVFKFQISSISVKGGWNTTAEDHKQMFVNFSTSNIRASYLCWKTRTAQSPVDKILFCPSVLVVVAQERAPSDVTSPILVHCAIKKVELVIVASHIKALLQLFSSNQDAPVPEGKSLEASVGHTPVSVAPTATKTKGMLPHVWLCVSTESMRVLCPLDNPNKKSGASLTGVGVHLERASLHSFASNTDKKLPVSTYLAQFACPSAHIPMIAVADGFTIGVEGNLSELCCFSFNFHRAASTMTDELREQDYIYSQNFLSAGINIAMNVLMSAEPVLLNEELFVQVQVTPVEFLITKPTLLLLTQLGSSFANMLPTKAKSAEVTRTVPTVRSKWTTTLEFSVKFSRIAAQLIDLQHTELKCELQLLPIELHHYVRRTPEDKVQLGHVQVKVVSMHWVDTNGAAFDVFQCGEDKTGTVDILLVKWSHKALAVEVFPFVLRAPSSLVKFLFAVFLQPATQDTNAQAKVEEDEKTHETPRKVSRSRMGSNVSYSNMASAPSTVRYFRPTMSAATIKLHSCEIMLLGADDESMLREQESSNPSSAHLSLRGVMCRTFPSEFSETGPSYVNRTSLVVDALSFFVMGRQVCAPFTLEGTLTQTTLLEAKASLAYFHSPRDVSVVLSPIVLAVRPSQIQKLLGVLTEFSQPQSGNERQEKYNAKNDVYKPPQLVKLERRFYQDDFKQMRFAPAIPVLVSPLDMLARYIYFVPGARHESSIRWCYEAPRAITHLTFGVLPSNPSSKHARCVLRALNRVSSEFVEIATFDIVLTSRIRINVQEDAKNARDMVLANAWSLAFYFDTDATAPPALFELAQFLRVDSVAFPSHSDLMQVRASVSMPMLSVTCFVGENDNDELAHLVVRDFATSLTMQHSSPCEMSIPLNLSAAPSPRLSPMNTSGSSGRNDLWPSESGTAKEKSMALAMAVKGALSVDVVDAFTAQLLPVVSSTAFQVNGAVQTWPIMLTSSEEDDHAQRYLVPVDVFSCHNVNEVVYPTGLFNIGIGFTTSTRVDVSRQILCAGLSLVRACTPAPNVRSPCLRGLIFENQCKYEISVMQMDKKASTVVIPSLSSMRYTEPVVPGLFMCTVADSAPCEPFALAEEGVLQFWKISSDAVGENRKRMQLVHSFVERGDHVVVTFAPMFSIVNTLDVPLTLAFSNVGDTQSASVVAARSTESFCLWQTVDAKGVNISPTVAMNNLPASALWKQHDIELMNIQENEMTSARWCWMSNAVEEYVHVLQVVPVFVFTNTFDVPVTFTHFDIFDEMLTQNALAGRDWSAVWTLHGEQVIQPGAQAPVYYRLDDAKLVMRILSDECLFGRCILNDTVTNRRVKLHTMHADGKTNQVGLTQKEMLLHCVQNPSTQTVNVDILAPIRLDNFSGLNLNITCEHTAMPDSPISSFLLPYNKPSKSSEWLARTEDGAFRIVVESPDGALSSRPFSISDVRGTPATIKGDKKISVETSQKVMHSHDMRIDMCGKTHMYQFVVGLDIDETMQKLIITVKPLYFLHNKTDLALSMISSDESCVSLDPFSAFPACKFPLRDPTSANQSVEITWGEKQSDGRAGGRVDLASVPTAKKISMYLEKDLGVSVLLSYLLLTHRKVCHVSVNNQLAPKYLLQNQTTHILEFATTFPDSKENVHKTVLAGGVACFDDQVLKRSCTALRITLPSVPASLSVLLHTGTYVDTKNTFRVIAFHRNGTLVLCVEAVSDQPAVMEPLSLGGQASDSFESGFELTPMKAVHENKFSAAFGQSSPVHIEFGGLDDSKYFEVKLTRPTIRWSGTVKATVPALHVYLVESAVPGHDETSSKSASQVYIGIAMSPLTLSYSFASPSVSRLDEWKTLNVELTVGRLQVAHFGTESSFPVVLASMKKSDSNENFFIVARAKITLPDDTTHNVDAGIHHVAYRRVLLSPSLDAVNIQLGNMRVNVEDSLIVLAMRQVELFKSSLGGVAKSDVIASCDDDTGVDASFIALQQASLSPPIFISRLHASPFAMYVTVNLQDSIKAPLFFSAGSIPINFSAFSLQRERYDSVPTFVYVVFAHYVYDSLMAAPMLLGSLDIVGNPLLLINSISQGVFSLFSVPSQAWERAEHKSVGLFLQCLSKGMISFSSHVTRGGLSSLYSVSSSLSRNLDTLSSGASDPALRYSHSIKDSLKRLGQGVVDGAIGTIMDPVHGAQERGAWGLVSGLGSGVVGIVTKPLSGVLGLVAQTSLSLSSSLRSEDDRAEVLFVPIPSALLSVDESDLHTPELAEFKQ